MATLVCRCGKRLNGAGAYPGRVGRCPACGEMIRWPEAEPEPTAIRAEPLQVEPAGPTNAVLVRPSTTYVSSRKKTRKGKSRQERRGLVRRPGQLESSLRETLRYPLWDETGLALLAVLPPVLWLTSLPVIGLLPLIFQFDGLILVLASFATPMVFFFALVVGYTLLCLGRVLVSSALGEIDHPRLPEWDFFGILSGLGRWLWAGVVGFAVGGMPALVYWLNCGDLDLFDRIVLGELAAVGMAYVLMAMTAALLHEDVRAANPITVVQAIRRVGWAYFKPCLLAGAIIALLFFAMELTLRAPHPVLAAIGLYLFWVLVLYSGMIVLRVLGLVYHRHAAQLGWFRTRPQWGA